MSAEPIADHELDGLFHPLARYASLVLAVSGGADSTALMHLVHRWAGRRAQAATLVVATVDHGLREGSAAEAAAVATQARKLGLPHHVLRWSGVKPATGLQEAAREARYGLLTSLGEGLPPPTAIVTAHTRDDQVETFLMQLARGSGIDGLAGMMASPPQNAGTGRRRLPERPLIDVPKARLVATLKAAGQTWIEDPSNESAAFERVRWRRARTALAGLGLGDAAIARSVKRLQRARETLEAATALAWTQTVKVHEGAFGSLAATALAAQTPEVAIRLLRRLVMAFGGQGELPPLSQIEALGHELAAGPMGGRSLAGTVVRRQGDQIRVLREPGRAGLPVLTIAPGSTAIWDHRFGISLGADAPAPVDVRGLGREGLALLGAEARDRAPWPAEVLVTLPSLWRDGRLLCVPHLGTGRGQESYPPTPKHGVNFLW